MAATLKKHWNGQRIFDPDRITQYESARYRNYDETYDYSNLDVYSRMYPALSEIQEYLDKDGSKPFLLESTVTAWETDLEILKITSR